MHIERLRIKNYKAFRQSDSMALGRGFNIIVGPNNSGKTALLETLRMRDCPSNPYRGTSIPRDRPLAPEFIFEFTLLTSGQELKSIALRYGANEWVPVDDAQDPQRVIDRLFEQQSLRFEFHVTSSEPPTSTQKPSHGLFPFDRAVFSVQLVVSNDRQSIGIQGRSSDKPDALLKILERGFRDYIYVFRPERPKIGTSSVNDTDILEPDASNLATVLFKLQENTARFDRFKNHVRTIFPSIKNVVVASAGGGLIGIKLGSVDPDLERDDLLVRLEESGTGIGQVLAILYVAMTRTNNIIAIDEPNSFLHPGAAKKLIQILKTYPQNQYIISTHSVELISVTNPDTIHLVSWNGSESNIEQLSRSSIENMRRVLADVGASLSDVFGADIVIWVEGPTEEACFPKIAMHRDATKLIGVSFVALRNTGDLEAKGSKAEAAWELYERLSKGSALIPPALAFSFDRESRSETEIEDMKRRSKQKAHFLPRAAYENYLLVPEAIAAILSSEFERCQIQKPCTVDQVTDWIKLKGGGFLTCRIKWDGDLNNVTWLAKCNAAKLLNALFQDLSERTLTYHKLSHSVALTDWLLENRPELITELSDYVEGLLSTDPD